MAAVFQTGSLRVGDTVNVPGDMHGVIRFIGSVDGKKGTFAGVELASQYAARGKNSGDVRGKYYFNTTLEGSGIFLPVDKAEKRMSASSTSSSVKPNSLRTASVADSPTAPAVGRKTPRITSVQKPAFSQSLGPAALQARVASPSTLKPTLKRESLARPQSPVRQRPASPVRKPQNPPVIQTPGIGRLQTPKTRPSVGLAKSTMGTPAIKASGLRAPSYANGGPNKFSQSLRQSISRTPSRMRVQGAPPVTAATPLGPEDRFDEDDTILEEADGTPTPATRNGERASQDSMERLELEAQRLKDQLQERDKQLDEQAESIAEMEQTLSDLSAVVHTNRDTPNNEADLPKDIQNLRSALREKNERIKELSAEFDANRADFRSTIDTLEMASSETERVYEQRVEELLEQVRLLQERNEDVESVAQQFKQLEELVQELEDGLEESRRAEAEARSEVEFLRGEVERGKSELRREKERSATKEALEGSALTNEELEELQSSLTQKDDEIRGLKAIIQNLQSSTHQQLPSRDSHNASKSNGVINRHSRMKSTNTIVSQGARNSADTDLQKQIRDLESLLQQKSSREEELQVEVRELRKSVNLSGSKWTLPSTLNGTAGALGLGHHRSDSDVIKHNSAGSQKTIVGQLSRSPVLNSHRRKDSTVPELADHQDAPERAQPGSPLKDAFGIDSDGSEAANEERRRREAAAYHTPPHAPPSISEASTSAQWCEICEESGHDILNCANMMGSSTHRELSPTPELKSGKDVVREGFRRSNGSGHLNTGDRPLPLRKSVSTDPPYPPPTGPLPPAPPQRTTSLGLAGNLSNGGGSNRSSATPASSGLTASSTMATPTKTDVVRGTGDQAGMIAGKTSGVIDPDRWCALCEHDGHESVDCPVEEAF